MAKRNKAKAKLPKRFAGVKIPKAARRGPVADFLTSSGGQVILAEALLAAASVLAVKGTDPDSRTGRLVRHPVEGMKDAGRSALGSAEEGMATASSRLSHAFSEAIRAFRVALSEPTPREMEREPDAEREFVETEPAAAAAPAKKKSSYTQPDASVSPQ